MTDAGQLVRYDAASRALAEAHRVDEVKGIRDAAVAMQAYAKQAKDTELIRHATEIRLRAERRAGELLIEMGERHERQKSGDASGGNGSSAQPLPPKLADLGISKTQSSRWQATARIPQDKFERNVERAGTKAYDRLCGIVTGVAMNSYAERGLDLYETPAAATRALLEVESFEGTIWEPACGPGAIVSVLRAAGHRVIATDLVDYGCPDSAGGVDFLTQAAAPEGARVIVTNPPFMHAPAFVRTALKLVPRVVMLLRLAFLETPSRSDILDGGQFARIYPFRNRLPMMHRNGWDGPQASSALALAWFVWDRAHRGPTELHRISWVGDEAPADSSNDDINKSATEHTGEPWDAMWQRPFALTDSERKEIEPGGAP